MAQNYKGYRRPVNAIVVAGNPLVQYLKVETAAQMLPGRLVKKGTNDDDIVVATQGLGSGGAIGWLGYEQAHEGYRPSTVDTSYAAGDWAPVLSGGNFVLLAAATSGAINKGSYLGWASAGVLTVAATANNEEIAVAEESITGGASDIMVRSLI